MQLGEEREGAGCGQKTENQVAGARFWQTKHRRAFLGAKGTLLGYAGVEVCGR